MQLPRLLKKGGKKVAASLFQTHDVFLVEKSKRKPSSLNSLFLPNLFGQPSLNLMYCRLTSVNLFPLRKKYPGTLPPSLTSRGKSRFTYEFKVDDDTYCTTSMGAQVGGLTIKTPPPSTVFKTPPSILFLTPPPPWRIP